jgi:hypothetical protein
MSKKPAKPGAAAEVEEWPPRRKHHKVAAPVQQSSQERYESRIVIAMFAQLSSIKARRSSQCAGGTGPHPRVGRYRQVC